MHNNNRWLLVIGFMDECHNNVLSRGRDVWPRVMRFRTWPGDIHTAGMEVGHG